MQVHVGTSGFSYKQWKGRFYPAELPDLEMLRYYSGRFPTVEINNTFYRMPSRDLLARWAQETPAAFRFALKAPRRITHEKRLADTGEALSYFLNTAAELATRLGPVLYQLPPFLKKDLARLQDFLARLPPGGRAAFEFRHASWFAEDVYEVLRGQGAALCVAETDADDEDAAPSAPLVTTARWGYLRLRRTAYGEGDLQAWSERIRAQPWEEAFVFFKHEDEAKGPAFAAELIRLLGPAPP